MGFMASPPPPASMDGILCAQPAGRFDFTALEPILAELQQARGVRALIPRGVPALILDLSKVTALTSSGIGVIMKLHQDTDLVLAAVPAPLLELLSLAGVDKLVAVTPTVEEARARLQRPRAPGRS